MSPTWITIETAGSALICAMSCGISASLSAAYGRSPMTAYEKPPSVAAEAAVAEGAAGGALRLSLLQAARRYRGNPRAAHFLSMRGFSAWRCGDLAAPGPSHH